MSALLILAATFPHPERVKILLIVTFLLNVDILFTIKTPLTITLLLLIFKEDPKVFIVFFPVIEISLSDKISNKIPDSIL